MKLGFTFRWSLLVPLSLALSPPALAVTVLRQVDQVDPNGLTLVFSEALTRDQIKIEYFNNNLVQVSLRGVGINPARIIPFTSGALTKAFVYQFVPNTVRCRLFAREKDPHIKENFYIKLLGKKIQMRLNPAPNPSQSELDPAEKDLYEKIEKGVHPAPAPEQPAAKVSEPVTASVPQGASALERPTVKTPMPSLSGVLLKFFGVLVAFGVLAWLFVKVLRSERAKKTGIVKAINKLATHSLGKDQKLIQVVSTHYLDPKKKIVVAKVAGRLLVLGVSSDSINLITTFTDHGNPEDSLHAPIFSELLGEADRKTEVRPDLTDLAVEPPSSASFVPESDGIRSRIRSRLEGLKPL